MHLTGILGGRHKQPLFLNYRKSALSCQFAILSAAHLPAKKEDCRMDVILDTNIYVQDFKMRRTQFQELFTYLTRTGSLLVIPSVVLQETVHEYREALSAALQTLRQAWRRLRGVAQSELQVYDGPLDIDAQVELFQE
jgi:hypothetical protein